MQTAEITFGAEINASLQVGDVIYYSPTTAAPNSGFSTVNNFNSIVLFGVVTKILKNGNKNVLPNIPPNTIVVLYDNIGIELFDVNGNSFVPPQFADPVVPPNIQTDFIMFNKNKQVNSSSLIGYYAEVKFVNNSTEKVELFSIGAEVSESSK